MLLFKNNAFAKLAVGLTSSSSTLTVSAGEGARFPVVAAPDYMKLTLADALGNVEIVKVTAHTSSSDSFTIVRAQEGTAARPWAIGDIVESRLTAGTLSPVGLFNEAQTNAAARIAINALPDSGVNGFLVRTGIDATVSRSLAVGSNGFLGLSNSDGVSGNPTITANAASANTASTLVARDASGDFSAGTITASLSGNATTATSAASATTAATATTAETLKTARLINGVSFNGSTDITVSANTPGTLTLNTSGTGLSGSTTFNGGTTTFTVAINATSANTGGAIVARDVNGDFSARTITASLNGNATSATTAANGGVTSVNAATGAVTIAGYAGLRATVFTANGTFTIPADVTAVKVTVVGGGGGGGQNQQGGGGGGAAIRYLTGLTPNSTLSVVIGAGGAGRGAASGVGPGTSGGASSVSSGSQTITTFSATGGSGAGPGGLGSGGGLNIKGGGGTSSFGACGTNVSGAGGSSILGGESGVNIGAGPAGAGAAAFGGGGGSGANSSGASGASGVVIFEY